MLLSASSLFFESCSHLNHLDQPRMTRRYRCTLWPCFHGCQNPGGGKGYKASCSHASKKHDLRPDQTRMTSQYCFTTMAVLPQQSTLRSVRAARSPSRHASQNHELSSQRKRTTNTVTSSVTASMTMSLFKPSDQEIADCQLYWTIPRHSPTMPLSSPPMSDSIKKTSFMATEFCIKPQSKHT
ncbi:hypothetical protein BO86DRAFT_73034 [Aspergillus japonicus CBS 114.51]|uniref:Uncharacterized protein n=1 Tax=Aspergillus japonicus CBS 114.51 TaxID=1448312 RepID=A0A8T8XHF7_ASPJA|nr:hypothetical protein BO86DRAFT_73034 [Aspergillus japonicus CBS 114.51]RAH86772.1 hypothetical protein BO86DRAFT_73034 [Aspergillus japonicus CBS 114.51]